MKRSMKLAAMLACLPASAAAQATPVFSPADHADAECALLMFAASQEPGLDETESELTGATAIYFIGKMVGRGVDYEAAIQATLDRFGSADLEAVGERCGDELIGLGEGMQRFGTQVQQLEQPRQ